MTKRLLYTATGAEGSSFTVPGLSGKSVLGAFRAELYKRAITTTPDEDDEIKITGTDQGGSILSSDGTVGLRSGDGLLLNEKLDFVYES